MFAVCGTISFGDLDHTNEVKHLAFHALRRVSDRCFDFVLRNLAVTRGIIWQR